MNPVTGLSLGRLALGAASTASPDLAAGVFGLNVARNPQLSYMTRLFGGREILMGVLTLTATGTARRNLVLGGMAVDAVDAAAGLLAGRRGQVSTAASAKLVVPALAAVAAAGFALSKRG